VGVFLATGVIVNGVVKSVEDKVTIQVFIKDVPPLRTSTRSSSPLISDPLVQGVEYTTKEQALAKFKKDMAQSRRSCSSLRATHCRLRWM